MPADLEDAADASESPRAAVERDEDAADVDTDSQAERVVVSDNSDDEEEGQPGVDCAIRQPLAVPPQTWSSGPFVLGQP